MQTDPRARVLELVRRHGWNATAFQTLEPGYSYFFHGEDACVAYVDVGSAWVVAGAPIAAAGALRGVTAAFLEAAGAAGKRCCFFGAEDRLRAATRGLLHGVPIGEQPAWDPGDWPRILSERRSLREQLRRARAKSVRVRELSAAELGEGETRRAMAGLVERWLARRPIAPMRFLVRVEPFTFPSERRCFVAELGERCVGFAAVIPVPARGGWFLEDLVRAPGAPNGTAELLVDAVMRWAAGTGSSFLTLGLAPLSGDVGGVLRFARRHMRFLYDFRGLRSHRAKLSPKSWSAIHLLHPPSQGALRSLMDALCAFTGVGFVRFGLHSLLLGSRRAWDRAALVSVRSASSTPAPIPRRRAWRSAVAAWMPFRVAGTFPGSVGDRAPGSVRPKAGEHARRAPSRT